MPSTAADHGPGTGQATTRAGRAGADGQGATRPPVFLAGPGSLAGDTVVLDGPEGRHAAAVRRLAPGERADLTDGAGLVAECVVTAVHRGQLELAVRARRITPRAEPTLAVAQALPKGDRGPLAVELMTEAGVDEIVPWAAERCVTRWRGEHGDRALARWRATAREAAKQSRRAWLPEVTGPVALAGLVRRVEQAALAVLLDPAAAPAGALPLPPRGQILVIVGPEGGISPGEERALVGAGAIPASLGPTILRTSTAGVVAASVLLSRCGRWDRPPG